ncbi:hypothetical protein VTI28DRAFT_8180 [Corynascus sepedonium]
MRGLPWTETYFPNGFFTTDERIDDDEKYFELPSMLEERRERMVWLGCRIAEAGEGKWLQFDKEAKRFGVDPTYEVDLDLESVDYGELPDAGTVQSREFIHPPAEASPHIPDLRARYLALRSASSAPQLFGLLLRALLAVPKRQSFHARQRVWVIDSELDLASFHHLRLQLLGLLPPALVPPCESPYIAPEEQELTITFALAPGSPVSVNTETISPGSRKEARQRFTLPVSSGVVTIEWSINCAERQPSRSSYNFPDGFFVTDERIDDDKKYFEFPSILEERREKVVWLA